MARIVFKLMDVTEYKRISKVKFRNFLTENPNLIDLFDMLEVNTKKGKALKIENYLGTYSIFALKGIYLELSMFRGNLTRIFALERYK